MVTVDRYVVNSHDASSAVGVVNKLDRRRVLLTTRSTCRGKIFEIQCFGQSLEEISTLTLVILEFLYETHIRTGGRKPRSFSKTSSIR